MTIAMQTWCFFYQEIFLKSVAAGATHEAARIHAAAFADHEHERMLVLLRERWDANGVRKERVKS